MGITTSINAEEVAPEISVAAEHSDRRNTAAFDSRSNMREGQKQYPPSLSNLCGHAGQRSSMFRIHEDDNDSIVRLPIVGTSNRDSTRRAQLRRGSIFSKGATPRRPRRQRCVVPTSCSSFVSAVVRERHAPGMPVLTNPEKSKPFYAGVLLLDISGYTALTEWLSDNAKNGAEEMSAALTSYFSAILTLVRAHGGDVYKFAGDALLCLYRGDHIERNMVDTALDAVQTLADFSVLNGATTLSLHAAACCGTVAGMHLGGKMLGGVRRWEWNLQAPEVLKEVGALLKEAECGQVGVSKQCWEAYGAARPHVHANAERCATFKVLANGGVVVTSSQSLLSLCPKPRRIMTTKSGIVAVGARADDALDDEEEAAETGLSGYVMRSVREYFQSLRKTGALHTSRHLLNANRLCSVVFCMLPPANDLEEAQSVLAHVQDGLRLYNGMLRQYLTDDKGTVAIAVWGCPPLAHQDDGVRALSFAAFIVKQHSEISCGVTTGMCFTGIVGDALRCEYVVVGAAVNLSARLMGKAGPGQVLCDDATRSLFQHKLQTTSDSFTEDGAGDAALNFSLGLPRFVSVKGIERRVKAFPVLPVVNRGGQRFGVFNSPRHRNASLQVYNAVHHTLPPMYGRTNDLDTVVGALDMAWQDEAGYAMVGVVGAVGIGKTTFAQHVVARCKTSFQTVTCRQADGLNRPIGWSFIGPLARMLWRFRDRLSTDMKKFLPLLANAFSLSSSHCQSKGTPELEALPQTAKKKVIVKLLLALVRIATNTRRRDPDLSMQAFLTIPEEVQQTQEEEEEEEEGAGGGRGEEEEEEELDSSDETQLADQDKQRGEVLAAARQPLSKAEGGGGGGTSNNIDELLVEFELDSLSSSTSTSTSTAERTLTEEDDQLMRAIERVGWEGEEKIAEVEDATPLLLVMDGLQNADSASLEFLEELWNAQERGAMPHVAVLVLYQRLKDCHNQGSIFDMQGADARLERLFDRCLPRLALDPLDPKSQKRLLMEVVYGREAEEASSNLGIGRLPSPPEDLLNHSAEASGGNPRLLRSIVNTWLQDGTIVVDDGAGARGGGVITVKGDLRRAVLAPNIVALTQMWFDAESGWANVLSRAATLLPQPFLLRDVQLLADCAKGMSHAVSHTLKGRLGIIVDEADVPVRDASLSAAWRLQRNGMWQAPKGGGSESPALQSKSARAGEAHAVIPRRGYELPRRRESPPDSLPRFRFVSQTAVTSSQKTMLLDEKQSLHAAYFRLASNGVFADSNCASSQRLARSAAIALAHRDAAKHFVIYAEELMQEFRLAEALEAALNALKQLCLVVESSKAAASFVAALGEGKRSRSEDDRKENDDAPVPADASDVGGVGEGSSSSSSSSNTTTEDAETRGASSTVDHGANDEISTLSRRPSNKAKNAGADVEHASKTQPASGMKRAVSSRKPSSQGDDDIPPHGDVWELAEELRSMTADGYVGLAVPVSVPVKAYRIAGEASAKLNEPIEAVMLLEQALKISGEGIPRGLTPKSTRLHLREQFRLAGLQEANHLVGGNLADPEDPHSGRENRRIVCETVRSLEVSMDLYERGGYPHYALLFAFRALNLASVLGPVPELAEAYAKIAAAVGSVVLSKRAMMVALQTGELSCQMQCTLIASRLSIGLGRWDETCALLRDLRGLADKTGNTFFSGQALEMLSWQNALRGSQAVTGSSGHDSSTSVLSNMCRIAEKRADNGMLLWARVAMLRDSNQQASSGAIQADSALLTQVQKQLEEAWPHLLDTDCVRAFGACTCTLLLQGRWSDIMSMFQGRQSIVPALMEQPPHLSDFDGHARLLEALMALADRGFADELEASFLNDLDPPLCLSRYLGTCVSAFRAYGDVTPIALPHALLIESMWVQVQHRLKWRQMSGANNSDESTALIEKQSASLNAERLFARASSEAEKIGIDLPALAASAFFSEAKAGSSEASRAGGLKRQPSYSSFDIDHANLLLGDLLDRLVVAPSLPHTAYNPRHDHNWDSELFRDETVGLLEELDIIWGGTASRSLLEAMNAIWSALDEAEPTVGAEGDYGVWDNLQRLQSSSARHILALCFARYQRRRGAEVTVSV